MKLVPICDSIWLDDGGLVNFHGFQYPTRSVIVRFDSDDLWIWSPIELTSELKLELDHLGKVRHIVSPNKLHHLHLQEWTRAYPLAELWGPRSTIQKRKDLKFREALTDIPPPEWGSVFDQAWFRGSLLMDEIVFFHRPSSTAIIADLSENFSRDFLSRHWSWWQRAVAKFMRIVVGYGYAPLEWRLSWINRQPARKALEKLLAWHPARVIVAHGEWQKQNGQAYLLRAFAWLRPSKRNFTESCDDQYAHKHDPPKTKKRRMQQTKFRMLRLAGTHER